MAIVFPASPSTNDTFTAGSITYKWDGAKWIGLGVTPADRLVEGSNSLEINASNNLIWTGNKVGIGTDAPNEKLDVRGKLYLNNGSSTYIDAALSNGLVVTNPTAIRFELGSERLRITSDGRLLVGLTASVDSNSALQVEGRNTITAIRYSAATGNAGSKLELSRSASNTVGTTAAVSATDELGEIRFRGASTGSAFNTGASINAVIASGTISASSFPTDLLFKTTSNGSASAIERLRITSDGNVGINQTSPTSQSGKVLHISGDTGGQARIHLSTSASGHAADEGHYIVSQGAESGANAGQLAFISLENRNFVFTTGSTGANATRLTIQHDGNLNIADGNLIVASGHGIDFSADANAAGNQSEVLNDYEEGVTTSTLTCGTSGTITLSNNQVSYVKVGDLVNVHGRLDVLSVSSPTGELLLDLPFNAANQPGGGNNLASHSAVSLFIWSGNSGAGYNQTGLYVGWISGNQNKIRIRYGSTATPGSSASNAMQAGTEVRFTATYRTA